MSACSEVGVFYQQKLSRENQNQTKMCEKRKVGGKKNEINNFNQTREKWNTKNLTQHAQLHTHTCIYIIYKLLCSPGYVFYFSQQSNWLNPDTFFLFNDIIFVVIMNIFFTDKPMTFAPLDWKQLYMTEAFFFSLRKHTYKEQISEYWLKTVFIVFFDNDENKNLFYN